MKRTCLLAIVLVFVACKNSSSMMGAPPANIAGTYMTVTSTNSNVATYTNCTGMPATTFEGRTVADLADLSCVPTNPLVITQTGNTWTMLNQTIVCAIANAVRSGNGTVSGSRIDGTTTLDSTLNILETQTITNGAIGTGGTVVVRVTRTTFSDSVLSGSCSIVPPLEEVWSP